NWVALCWRALLAKVCFSDHFFLCSPQKFCQTRFGLLLKSKKPCTARLGIRKRPLCNLPSFGKFPVFFPSKRRNIFVCAWPFIFRGTTGFRSPPENVRVPAGGFFRRFAPGFRGAKFRFRI